MVLATRRIFLAVPAGLLLASCKPASAASQAITVYKDPGCGCCTVWVEHLRKAGFAATVVASADRTALQSRYGLPPQFGSCHTGVVGPYFIEGHVPADDIKRLLREAAKARGLAVPGMPIGSPGMEMPDGSREPYDVLLVKKDGATAVFARYS
ncbi:MAG: DUF411 domain-containing protein [Caulobacter sp.]|nr:DUF411 domain-containing protein [Caulobacter sp.]